jgi:hypothetical protein
MSGGKPDSIPRRMLSCTSWRRPSPRKQAQILRYVMAWGLDHPHAWTRDRQRPDRTHPVHMLVEPALWQQVQGAVALKGVSVAAWVRQVMRNVTIADFPASWRAGKTAPRSHESGHYRRRFMLRLDDETSRKLEMFIHAFRPAAEVIRQLIGQAKPDDCPESGHLAADVGKGACDAMG